MTRGRRAAPAAKADDFGTDPHNGKARPRSRLSGGNTTAGHGLGRSAPRSRLGCVTCKQRRVRCDEVRPICGHCSRLQLECQYKPHSQKWRSRQTSKEIAEGSIGQNIQHLAAERPSAVQEGLQSSSISTFTQSRRSNGFDGSSVARQTQRSIVPDNVSPAIGFFSNGPGLQPSFYGYGGGAAGGGVGGGGYTSRSGYGGPTPFNSALPSWTLARTVDFDNIFSEVDTSWAGELSCVLPDMMTPPASLEQQQDAAGQFEQVVGVVSLDTAPQTPLASPTMSRDQDSVKRPSGYPAVSYGDQPVQRGHTPSSLAGSRNGPGSSTGTIEDPKHLLQLFRKIHQPPAAILIGGYERWRRLQRHLCRLSEHSQAVNHALMCVIELLMIDEMAAELSQNRDACMRRILEHHSLACQEIERKLCKRDNMKASSRDCLLASVFLLGWFEVIKDQDSHPSLFPRQLADAVITMNTNWSRYSQQLLSWLNTLDSKAAHLGREHLLSPESLHVVSSYHTEITSSLQQGGDWHEGDEDDSDHHQSSEASPGESHSSPVETMTHAPALKLGQVKQAVLNTILQPALAWYLTSQSYCRRISAHDKHHRRRFTSDDEFEVITACKQIETELFELWDYRPAVISVPAEQLMAVTSPDVATRLEEIFSTYLASFWILFVHLHRVCWWHLPHSPLARRALTECWKHMQAAYGEEVNGPLRKVIHPCLLWPLFLFGTECRNNDQRQWAIEQLEALSEAKPVVPREGTDADTLPPFRLSSGATRNAHRASVLLRELIKEQDAKKQRVDDRDLSMRMFGCYFSIV